MKACLDYTQHCRRILGEYTFFMFMKDGVVWTGELVDSNKGLWLPPEYHTVEGSGFFHDWNTIPIYSLLSEYIPKS